jgi:epoxyqueuosine reductase
MIRALLKEIDAHGDRGALVPVSRMEDLRREMAEIKNETQQPFSDWSWMAVPDSLGFTPRAILTVMTCSPKVLLRFHDDDRQVCCIVPPYYTDEDAVSPKVLSYISAYLTPLGFQAAPADNIPLKPLAVHCGLAQYGRNNITFSEDFGSHMRLLAYYTDIPCDGAPWFPLRRMVECDHCRACVAACPPQVIRPDRRTIDSVRCLTMLNEVPGEFPDWLPPDAHNALVGCMRCQDCCPRNANTTHKITEGVTFTAAETAELLHHEGDAPYSEALAARLEATGISKSFYKLLPRNLAAFLRSVPS